jgi:hypothetical protein
MKITHRVMNSSYPVMNFSTPHMHHFVVSLNYRVQNTGSAIVSEKRVVAGGAQMSDDNPQVPPQLLYSPPAPEAVEAFARQVCQRLGTEYTTPEVVAGFSTFIKVVTDINVKNRNKISRHGQVDNAE